MLENDAEYRRWTFERCNATPIDPDRRAQAAVRQELEALHHQSLAKLGPREQSAKQPMADEAEQLASASSPATSTTPPHSRQAQPEPPRRQPAGKSGERARKTRRRRTP